MTPIFHAAHFNLKVKREAVKVLFPNAKVTLMAVGPFTDSEGEAVFGFCEVTEVRRHTFTFEADGALWTARLDAVIKGFNIVVQE